MNQFWKLFTDQACSFLHSRLDDVILLDADSTKTDTCGKQKGSAYIKHYDQIGFHPLVINGFSTPMLVEPGCAKGNHILLQKHPLP